MSFFVYNALTIHPKLKLTKKRVCSIFEIDKIVWSD